MELKIDELKEKFGKLSVLVVGDMFLDIDYIGGYSGYSREVEQLPIFRAEKVKYSPGGGGNLAVCFATLGVKTTVAGYWGRDVAGTWNNEPDPNRKVLNLCFRNKFINRVGMVVSGRTPVFGKYYLHTGQHISRYDLVAEKPDAYAHELLVEKLENIIPDNFDFVTCADYEEVQDYGVCSPEVIDAVRQNAKVKFATSRKNIARFKGFDYLIQNEKEIREQIDPVVIWDNSLETKEIVTTMGGKGAKALRTDKFDITITSQELTRNIDPCGCGDMFYAAYSASVMSGYDTEICLKIANSAARVVAKKLFGTGQATIEELISEELISEYIFIYGIK